MDLPDELPAGTWIRGSLGPMKTYAVCRLVDGRYEGGTGSAYQRFGPEYVIQEGLTPEGDAKLKRICAEYHAYACVGTPTSLR